VAEQDLPPIQPRGQSRIWKRMGPGDGPERLQQVIVQLRAEDGTFTVQGGSWTSERSWVDGYESVLISLEKASSLFHERMLAGGVDTNDALYRKALFHLLATETSCFRYWGQGRWTDYGGELARRTIALLDRSGTNR
jgi:hypothetical protein